LAILKTRSLFWKIFRKHYRWDSTHLISKYFAKKISKKIKDKDYDFIIGDRVSSEIAYLQTKIPIIYRSDATFRLMTGFYKSFSNMSRSSFLQGDQLERMAIQNAAICIYHTYWAANSALNDYRANPETVSVIYSGPNIPKACLPVFIPKRNKLSAKECRLFLMGVDWHRKGGAIAVETAKILNDRGINATLTICGCTLPPSIKGEKYLDVIPFLDKRKKEDLEKYIKLYREANFFILPARAECLGIVIIEAFAFGLPVLATAVGGISEIVKDDETGYLFSVDDGAEEYAKKIEYLLGEPARYKYLSYNAFALYQEKLNWKTWAAKLYSLLEERKRWK
jgi:glycosyltransferase involved in cell wall biosynthesis